MSMKLTIILKIVLEVPDFGSLHWNSGRTKGRWIDTNIACRRYYRPNFDHMKYCMGFASRVWKDHKQV